MVWEKQMNLQQHKNLFWAKDKEKIGEQAREVESKELDIVNVRWIFVRLAGWGSWCCTWQWTSPSSPSPASASTDIRQDQTTFAYDVQSQTFENLFSASIPVTCGFPGCPGAAYVVLTAFSQAVFTCLIKRSDRKRSVLLLIIKQSPYLSYEQYTLTEFIVLI